MDAYLLYFIAIIGHGSTAIVTKHEFATEADCKKVLAELVADVKSSRYSTIVSKQCTKIIRTD